jgi:acetyl-CoA acetyltransferase
MRWLLESAAKKTAPVILATQAHLTREVQDRFAARSQQRFAAAQKAGRFAAEIVAVEAQAEQVAERPSLRRAAGGLWCGQ